MTSSEGTTPLDSLTRDKDREHSPQVGVYLQDACWQHRFIRSKDASNVPERPERLRAVMVGLSAAISRLEGPVDVDGLPTSDFDDLADTLNKMSLSTSSTNVSLSFPNSPVKLVKSDATVDFFDNPAVKFIHGDVDGDVYLERLRDLTRDSQGKIMKGESEIPDNLSQGDLYLCPTSLLAMQGAVGTVCEAIDSVLHDSSCPRAFVAVRPPGHHCGEDTPSGFCFVNNVAIGAAHAHLSHKIHRVVILDIDLHHGNGTQSIAWQINEETYRKTIDDEDDEPSQDEHGAFQVYYGSIHDILSYPCEDGKADLIQAASTSIHGPHGQYIENIHLETYGSEKDFFDVHYQTKYLQLIRKAEKFLLDTGGPGDDVLVFISCGLDACEHEHPYMSRHGRKVPTSFYHRFTRDTVDFANKYARGRLVSVLEGGYSDRALISGAMAHIVGMTANKGIEEPREWWNNESLDKLETLLAKKKKRGGRPSQPPPPAAESEPWLDRATNIFSAIEASSAEAIATATSPIPSSRLPAASVAPSSRTLRERKSKATPPPSASSSPSRPRNSKAKHAETTIASPQIGADKPGEKSLSGSDSGSNTPSVPPVKKLPRVILHVRPPPGYQTPE